jgi:hypothetical protein
MFRRTTALAALLGAMCLAQTVAPAAQRPNPADGAVQAGVYHNNYFGFDYKLPAGFEDRTAIMPRDGGGISYGLLHVSEPKQASRYSSSVTFFADDAGHWKSKDGAEYLARVTPQMQKASDAVGKMTSFEIGGHRFYRQDFSRRRYYVRQTIVATVMKGYVLSAALNANDPQGIDELIAGLRAMKFTAGR